MEKSVSGGHAGAMVEVRIAELYSSSSARLVYIFQSAGRLEQYVEQGEEAGVSRADLENLVMVRALYQIMV